jgi:hypothetical protein
MATRDFPIGRLGLVVVAAAGMTACVSRAGLESSAAPVDPDSRIGQAMIEAARNPGPYPKFSDIPKVPADMVHPASFAELVAPLEAQRAALAAHVGALPTASSDVTQAEAARLRALIAIEPPAADATARAEAYAQSLRQRAKPPPAPR